MIPFCQEYNVVCQGRIAMVFGTQYSLFALIAEKYMEASGALMIVGMPFRAV